MKSQELIGLMQDPARIRREHVLELEKLVEEFPYFQPAHLLLSLASRKWDPAVHQRTLRKAAIVATSRTRLFDLINSAEQGHDTVAEEQVQPSVSEIDVLKAAEIATQDVGTITQPTPVATVTVENKETKSDIIEQLETEIGRGAVTAIVEKEILRQPEIKTIDKPDAASFGDWLSLLKKNNGQDFKREKTPAKEAFSAEPETISQPLQNPADREQERQKKMALIDKIIETNPGLIRGREDQKFFKPENQAKESLLESEHLVTETLAKIYALQGNTSKAIRAYEILSLKNPQKSAYFASLIQQLKNNP